jgi:hypothetical protein
MMQLVQKLAQPPPRGPLFGPVGEVVLLPRVFEQGEEFRPAMAGLDQDVILSASPLGRDHRRRLSVRGA